MLRASVIQRTRRKLGSGGTRKPDAIGEKGVGMSATLPNALETSPDSTTVDIVEIDADEFEQAEMDPRVHDLANAAKAYGAALERDGRNR